VINPVNFFTQPFFAFRFYGVFVATYAIPQNGTYPRNTSSIRHHYGRLLSAR